jgi:glycerol kinase
MATRILAIDQGTTSSRAIVFDRSLRPIASAQASSSVFPHSGGSTRSGRNLENRLAP